MVLVIICSISILLSYKLITYLDIIIKLYLIILSTIKYITIITLTVLNNLMNFLLGNRFWLKNVVTIFVH